MTKEINQEDFLTEYLKDKKDWEIDDPFLSDKGVWTGQLVSNKSLEVDVYKGRLNYWCNISKAEFSHGPIAKFLIPATYQEFKTLMDIFLKTGI